MPSKRFNYRVGSVITYSAFGGEIRHVLVDEKSDDVKNGRPGFGGVLVDPRTFEPLITSEDDDLFGDVWIVRLMRW